MVDFLFWLNEVSNLARRTITAFFCLKFEISNLLPGACVFRCHILRAIRIFDQNFIFNFKFQISNHGLTVW